MAAAGQPKDAPSGDDPGATRQYVLAGLELAGLHADEAELAVIEAADALYRPLIDALIEAELDGIESEPGADMSRPPRSVEQR
jgi:hypothetical protein